MEKAENTFISSTFWGKRIGLKQQTMEKDKGMQWAKHFKMCIATGSKEGLVHMSLSTST